MLKGFRDFILRGNVVDLAVAVIIGAAFNAVVNSFVKDILGQFIAAVVGKPDFSGVVFKLEGTPINVGISNATISFVIVASVVYFFVVLPVNITARLKKPGRQRPSSQCPECSAKSAQRSGALLRAAGATRACPPVPQQPGVAVAVFDATRRAPGPNAIAIKAFNMV